MFRRAAVTALRQLPTRVAVRPRALAAHVPATVTQFRSLSQTPLFLAPKKGAKKSPKKAAEKAAAPDAAAAEAKGAGKIAAAKAVVAAKKAAASARKQAAAAKKKAAAAKKRAAAAAKKAKAAAKRKAAGARKKAAADGGERAAAVAKARKEMDSAELKFAKQLAEVAAYLGGEMEDTHSLKDLFRCCEDVWPSLKEFLKANGIKRMKVARGDKFDPSRHCVYEETGPADNDGLQPGRIVKVMLNGYTYRGKMLRPAACYVAVKE